MDELERLQQVLARPPRDSKKEEVRALNELLKFIDKGRKISLAERLFLEKQWYQLRCIKLRKGKSTPKSIIKKLEKLEQILFES